MTRIKRVKRNYIIYHFLNEVIEKYFINEKTRSVFFLNFSFTKT